MAFKFSLTIHLQDKAREMNIPISKIVRVLENPTQIVESKLHPDQVRYIGEGIAIMVNESSGIAITLYADRVITPLRPDQIAKGVQIKRKNNTVF